MTRTKRVLSAYLASRWVQSGLLLVVFGWGPLLVIVALASVGLWPDPNPNPIGPGLLFFFTSWPAIICLGVGICRVHFGTATNAEEHDPAAFGGNESQPWSERLAEMTALRLAAGFGGGVLFLYGLVALLTRPSGGAAVAIASGAAATYWGLTGRVRW